MGNKATNLLELLFTELDYQFRMCDEKLDSAFESYKKEKSEESLKELEFRCKECRNFIKSKIDNKEATIYDILRLPKKILKRIEKLKSGLLEKVELLETKYVFAHW